VSRFEIWSGSIRFKLRKGGTLKNAVFDLFRAITRAAIIIFLVAAVIGCAAKVVDSYLGATCISGFGTFNDACLEGK